MSIMLAFHVFTSTIQLLRLFIHVVPRVHCLRNMRDVASQNFIHFAQKLAFMMYSFQFCRRHRFEEQVYYFVQHWFFLVVAMLSRSGSLSYSEGINGGGFIGVRIL